MKKVFPVELNKYRVKEGPLGGDDSLGFNGAFMIPTEQGAGVQIISSNQEGWDHVSVTIWHNMRYFTPSWDDMCTVKDLFWEKEEVVMQLHPAEGDYINQHPNVLHLWAPQGKMRIPLPPRSMVGVVSED